MGQQALGARHKHAGAAAKRRPPRTLLLRVLAQRHPLLSVSASRSQPRGSSSDRQAMSKSMLKFQQGSLARRPGLCFVFGSAPFFTPALLGPSFSCLAGSSSQLSAVLQLAQHPKPYCAQDEYVARVKRDRNAVLQQLTVAGCWIDPSWRCRGSPMKSWPDLSVPSGCSTARPGWDPAQGQLGRIWP